MSFLVLPKALLPDWIDQLLGQMQVAGPKRRPGAPRLGDDGYRLPAAEQFIFDFLDSGSEIELYYPTTILPLKKFLLPQQETLFRYKEQGREIELQLDEQPLAIMGVHTCDLHAIHVLDQVLAQDGADQHYLARRARTTLVSIECLHPCSPTAFCRDMDTWTLPDQFDVHLTDLDRDFAVHVGSDKGAALLSDVPGLREATHEDRRRFEQVRSAKWARFPYRLAVDASELPGLLAAGYRSQIWEQLAQKCLGCGSCTAVCPTCVCFDVQDEIDFDWQSGCRRRVWDSCQFSEFAAVAGGHDFRGSRAARLRHRFNHKYKYQPQRTGLAGCVGCGRCAAACLVSIDPVDVLNDLQRQRAAASRHKEVRI